MPITHKIENNICVVSIEGDFNLYSATETINHTKTMAEDEQIQGMILNLKKVRHLDSEGIGIIASLAKQFLGRQKKFTLCEFGWEIANLLTISGLDKVIPFYFSEEEALVEIQKN
ncbi:MAG: STAS domain-containing protein [SAR324 cluster bacterium]|nr:STAS domain-containing protein [SAR324 cluster bacterium]